MLRRDPQARAFLRDVVEQAVTVADAERVKERRLRELDARQDWAGSRRDGLSRIGGQRIRLAGWPWAVAAAAVIALIASVYFQLPSAEPEIAKITGLSGSLQWTGDGGRVFHDLRVGTKLPGGTIEGMVPGSWFELEFNDGSTVTISGNSTLTFSDHGQKKLHLKEGNVSGNVKPQPAGKPMLIYTRSAMLEVLGTQFEVKAGISATTLNVIEGEVRVKRLNDGSTVDVPAKHRVIAAADREMSPMPVPDAASRWKSQLHLGPDSTYGKWSNGTNTQDAKLRAIPYTTPQGITIYTAAFGVSHGDKPFFLNICFHEPHAPIAAPDEIVSQYGELKDPAVIYSGTIDNTDRAIVRLLKKLEEIDSPENTLIVYSSDNGSYRADRVAALRGKKGSNFEGGIRVPGIFYWPGTITKGQVEHEPAGLVDLLPTVCGLLGIDKPEGIHLDGSDLSLLLTGSENEFTRYQPLFWLLPASGLTVAIRDGAYSLVAYRNYRLPKNQERMTDLMKQIKEQLRSYKPRTGSLSGLNRVFSFVSSPTYSIHRPRNPNGVGIAICPGRGFRRFLLRGPENVMAEWDLICLTHNLLKVFRSGLMPKGA